MNKSIWISGGGRAGGGLPLRNQLAAGAAKPVRQESGGPGVAVSGRYGAPVQDR